MKKHSLFVTVLLLLFSAAFTSCDSEPVDSQLVNADDSADTNSNDNNSPGSNTTGSYWPMALNNEWNYDAGSMGEYNMKIIGTENIGGVTYYKYEDFIASINSFPVGFSGNATNYTRKVNNDYKVRVTFVMTGNQEGLSMTLAPMEYTILKDNLAVGQSWTEEVQQSITITMDGMDPITTATLINATGTIMEKSESAVIDGVTYNDVIKVRFEQSASGTVDATSYYWFVKGKGLMKVQVDFTDSSSSDANYTIESYTIN